jgi:hypothetical protein
MQNVKQNLKEREHLEHLGADGRILLNKHGVRVYIGFIWLKIGPSGGI